MRNPSMIVTLCACVLALLSVPSYEQDTQSSTLTSPCPEVFVYDPPLTEPGWWSGVVTMSTDILLHSMWLDIVLDRQALGLGQLWDWLGNVTSQDNETFRIDNDDMQIRPGNQVSSRIFIQYDTLTTTPRLQAIRLNGKVTCNADTYQEATVSKPFSSNTNTNLDNMMSVPTPQNESNYSVHANLVNNSSVASKFLDRFYDLLYEV